MLFVVFSAIFDIVFYDCFLILFVFLMLFYGSGFAFFVILC